MRLLLVLSMVAAGICVSIQGPINARLRLAVGSPVFSAAFSFFSGSLVLACVMATGALGGTGFGFRGFMDAPPWAFLGGALGTSVESWEDFRFVLPSWPMSGDARRIPDPNNLAIRTS